MKIDLNAYGTELGFWIDAFKPFVDQASQSAMTRLKQELEDSRDNRRREFDWKLDKPVTTIDTDRYDGKNKTPHKVRIGWQFEAKFALVNKSKRDSLWMITKMSTHIHVYATADGKEILHFHHDMKDKGQLGPHVHMQFSEHYRKKRGRIPIAVPRFPSTVMLPTDCLDLVLCEFFPFTWPKSQSDSRGLTILQSRQKARLLAMAKALSDGWKGARKTPIAIIQECYAPELQIA